MEVINVNISTEKLVHEMGVLSRVLLTYKKRIKLLNKLIITISLVMLVFDMVTMFMIVYYVSDIQKYLLLVLNLANILLVVFKVAHERNNKLLPMVEDHARLSFIESYVSEEIYKPNVDVDHVNQLIIDLRKINSLGY